MNHVKNTARNALPFLLGIFAVFFSVAIFTACGEDEKVGFQVPDAPVGPVADYADALTPEEEEMLTAAVEQFERTSCGTLRIMVVRTTEGIPIEEVARNVANEWKLSTAEKSGVLLLLAVEDHTDRIEVSREWQDVLTNERCAVILKSIVPELQAGRYADACAKAVRAMELHFPK